MRSAQCRFRRFYQAEGLSVGPEDSLDPLQDAFWIETPGPGLDAAPSGETAVELALAQLLELFLMEVRDQLAGAEVVGGPMPHRLAHDLLFQLRG